MTRKVLLLAAIVTILTAVPAAAGPIGPVYPAPGGTTFTNTSGTSGATGGLSRTYTMTDPSGASYSDLWWGVYDILVPYTSFFPSGTNQAVGLPTIVGNEATWSGSTNWTIDNLSGSDYSFPVRFRLDVFDLFNNPLALIPSSSVPGLLGSAGAVVNLGLATGFKVNFGFEAWTGSSWIGVTSLYDSLLFTPSCTNCVNTSVSGGFWYAEPIPEPASLAFIGTGLLFGARRLRRRWA